jgi:hypothetical protein
LKDKLIKPDDFCEIVTDNLEKDGIKRGQRVLIVGHRALPISEEDPYTQRIKFFANILLDAKTMEFDPRLFLLDPRSVEKLKKKEQEKLRARFIELIDAMENLPDAAIN